MIISNEISKLSKCGIFLIRKGLFYQSLQSIAYNIQTYKIRFYKKADKIQKVLHVGTVIEGAAEYKSSRLNNKDRRQSIVDEVLSDKTLRNYSKKTYLQIQGERSQKRKTFKARKKFGSKK